MTFLLTILEILPVAYLNFTLKIMHSGWVRSCVTQIRYILLNPLQKIYPLYGRSFLEISNWLQNTLLSSGYLNFMPPRRIQYSVTRLAHET